MMVDNYMLDEVLDKIKETSSIEKLADTKICIDTDDNCEMMLFLKKL